MVGFLQRCGYFTKVEIVMSCGSYLRVKGGKCWSRAATLPFRYILFVVVVGGGGRLRPCGMVRCF